MHDYLYMAWTDHHDTASRQDWCFADKMLATDLKASGVNPVRRFVMYWIVHSCIGWSVFKAKSYTLAKRMNGWLPQLEADHGRGG